MSPHRVTLRSLLTLLLAATLWSGCETAPHPAAPAPKAAEGPARYEASIRRFERDDAVRPPAPGGVLFVGSSSIRMWNSLATDMAPMDIINRGFGGSTTGDVLAYVRRIVLPYRPRAIVFYAGDNDIARDKDSPEAVAAHFREFVDAVEDGGLRPDIHFVSIKPSPSRMKRWPQMRRANALIQAYTRQQPRVSYIDVAGQLLGLDGKPRLELYAKDGVHLADAGYRVWTRVIKPAVMAPIEPSTLYL